MFKWNEKKELLFNEGQSNKKRVKSHTKGVWVCDEKKVSMEQL